MDKAAARQRAWSELQKVAEPDSRFHLAYGEYTPDFGGSALATERLTSLALHERASVVLIAPDNCLEGLGAQAARDGKTQFMPTYGIRRGLIELWPSDVPAGLERNAVLPDAIEGFGRAVSLAQLRERHRIELVVTGASTASVNGVRFGKGGSGSASRHPGG